MLWTSRQHQDMWARRNLMPLVIYLDDLRRYLWDTSCSTFLGFWQAIWRCLPCGALLLHAEVLWGTWMDFRGIGSHQSLLGRCGCVDEAKVISRSLSQTHHGHSMVPHEGLGPNHVPCESSWDLFGGIFPHVFPSHSERWLGLKVHSLDWSWFWRPAERAWPVICYEADLQFRKPLLWEAAGTRPKRRVPTQANSPSQSWMKQLLKQDVILALNLNEDHSKGGTVKPGNLLFECRTWPKRAMSASFCRSKNDSFCFAVHSFILGRLGTLLGSVSQTMCSTVSPESC